MTDKPGAIKVTRKEEAIAHLAAIVDSSDDAILSKTPAGIITSWNKAAEKLYGYSAEEAVGNPITMLVPPERREELEQFTRKILQGERIKNLETVRVAKDGRHIHVSLTLSPIYDEEGALTGISIIARDNSERIRMERLLRESETRYRVLVESAPAAVFVHQEGEFVYANCAALGIFGVESMEELRRHTLFELLHKEDRDAVRLAMRRVMDGEEIPQLEYRALRVNGEEVSVESGSTLIVYGGVSSVQVVARDVTERKRADQEREAMLKELDYQRARFETVVQQLPVGVLIAEAPSGRLVYQNQHSCAILSSDLETVKSVADYDQWRLYRMDGSKVPVEEYPLARAVMKGETVLSEEYLISREGAPPCFICINATPLRDISGRITWGLAAFSDITESKVASKALAESEERLQLALDAAEMGSCDMDVQSGAGIWSRRHFLLLGYPPPEGESGPAEISMWQGLIHPDDRERVLRALEQARQEQRFFSSEHRVARADTGAMMWVDVKGRFLCDAGGHACRFIGVIFDVSDRKEAEDALRRSVIRFRRLADATPQIIWTARLDGSLDYVNAHFEKYSGMSSIEMQEHKGDPAWMIANLIHPDDRETMTEVWMHSVTTGAPYQLEARVRAADGNYRWHLTRALPERDEQGTVVKWYATATDIHELRETQEKLRASETRFRWLYESNLIAIFFWNSEGRITDANTAYCDLVGYSGEECRGGNLDWMEVTAVENIPKDLGAMEEIRSRGICKPYEKVFINRTTGERVAALTAIAKMADDGGEGIGFAVDLTELKKAEQAFKNSESTLKLAVETTALGIFDLDIASGKGEWSPIAKRHYGLPTDAEVDLDTVINGVHPEDRERIRQIAVDAASPSGAGTYSADYRTVGVDGEVRWVSMRAQVSYDDNGAPQRLVGACLDISDRIRAQQKLRDEMTERVRALEALRNQEQLLIRQGRLAAMGEMIANIAHQWRQPLNTLGLIIQELPTFQRRNLLSPEYLQESVDRAMQVINHMSQTIDGFRNFFGPEKEKRLFSGAEVLKKTLNILDGAFTEAKLEVAVDIQPETTVFGSPNEYSQVILNVLINAKDVLLERKTPQPRIELRLFREKEKTVLTVTDNGGGIPGDIIDKVFDPYFTTKGPDKGTGIGLFMSKTIIEKNMKGSLTVRNTDKGAQFRIEV